MATKYEGTFEIWFDGTGEHTKTRVSVVKWGKNYWDVVVPIGDGDSSSNIHLRAALEFIKQHWEKNGILSLTAAQRGKCLYITVKSPASSYHNKSYTLKIQEVKQ